MLEQIVVSAEQMRQIEERVFAAGMPVPALMEKAAGLCANRIKTLYPLSELLKVGILVGPGHNGGDALVVARELKLAGYRVIVCRPIAKLKELTANHADYAQSLGIPFHEEIEPLQDGDLIIDGLFGFGLARSLSGKIAELVDKLNSWSQPVVSIDIPSGIHTDTGEILGTAVRATHTLCLGLWKRAFFQDQALAYIGKAECLDLGIPPHTVRAIIPEPAPIRQMSEATARQCLPLPRPVVTHKYKQGHLLVIAGSNRYAGGVILTALGARGSGVGMLSVAVPESLKPILVNHLPEALIIGCPETEGGAIAQLPPLAADFSNFDVIACGPGLTLEAKPVLEKVLTAQCPLVLDADGLNILAQLDTIPTLSQRSAPTVLTPHLGEFKRLFPEIEIPNGDRISAAQIAAHQSGAIILFKGSRTVVAHRDGSVWLILASTPALARGGTGDILTGLIGGLMGQKIGSQETLTEIVATAAWWHARAAILAARERTELGVDAFTLSQYLVSSLVN